MDDDGNKVEEDHGGVVLKLVPPQRQHSERQAQCRRLLLDAMQKLESGELDELVLVTVERSQLYGVRWSVTDAVRAAGILEYAKQHLLASHVRIVP